MRPPPVPGLAPHVSPGQQSALLRQVPRHDEAVDVAQLRVPLGLTRQLGQPAGHGGALPTVVHPPLMHTPAPQVPHEVNPHLAA